ncbi:hypothetical protein BDP27DRAFT_1212116 [Rhodocollybia butyracea]|uniref:Uncharacterized protein n=1 Tax=Rhodocollybia butyracea TaxID=206335 RepID=A0A9P5Q6V8_9AGAR|nr:hypothetical protein BDP27DRAFT_1212116 [Rhodocollybia butyracea]
MSSTSNLSLKSSHSRKNSQSLTLSNTMGWLSRHSTQTSVSSLRKGRRNSPTPESEKKPARSIELVSGARTGPLGSGATVVRTPEEALHGFRPELSASSSSRPSLQRSATSSSLRKPVDSPPLPSLPIDFSNGSEEEEEEEDDNDLVNASAGLSWPTPPSRPSCPLPPSQSQTSFRSSLKVKSQSSIDATRVPSLPAHVASSPPQAPFEPVLVSSIPSGIVDPSTVLVTVETCTATYKTTFKTLTSRPSHLADYLVSLFPRPRRVSDASSIYSTASDDMSSYRKHLASEGLLAVAPVTLHIFLDRASAPYMHILNYLRSPVGSTESPETLPRAAQLNPGNSQSRLESLLELRDEASYLDLDDLYKLCQDEIRQRQPVLQPRLPRSHPTHSRGQSSNSNLSSSGTESHTSVSSMNTLLDRSSMRGRVRESSTTFVDRESTKASNQCSDPQLTCGLRSPPTPESWKDGRNSGSSTSTSTGSARNLRRNDLIGSPPSGWI